jgi:hypothetical protein
MSSVQVDHINISNRFLGGNDSGIESQHFSDPSVAPVKRILSDESGYLELNMDDVSLTVH